MELNLNRLKLVISLLMLSFVPKSYGVQCRTILNISKSEYYTLKEALQVSTSIAKQEKSRGNFWGVFGPLDADPGIWEMTYIDFTKLDDSKFQITAPVTDKLVKIKSGLTARQTLLASWGSEEVSVPLSTINQVAEHPIGQFVEFGGSAKEAHFESTYLLAELSTGQVVYVSHPLNKNQKGEPVYDELLFSQIKMAEAGALPFVQIGIDSDVNYRSILPVFNPETKLLEPLVYSIESVRGVFGQIDLMLDLQIPFWSQKLSPALIEAVKYDLGLLVLGGWYNGELGIYGIHKSALASWRLELEDKTEYVIAPEYADSKHPFHMSNVVKALLFNQVPASDKVQFIYERILQGKAREAFTLIYLDMLFPNNRALDPETGRIRISDLRETKNFWANTAFEARINTGAVISPKGWVNGRSFRQHFKKHGAKEFGLESKGEYLEMATEFFESTDEPTILIRQQGSGEYFKYNFKTNELGVLTTDFKIITYYQLNEDFRPRSEFEGSLADQLLD